MSIAILFLSFYVIQKQKNIEDGGIGGLLAQLSSNRTFIFFSFFLIRNTGQSAEGEKIK